MQEKRMRGESAKQVAIDVLRAAGEPLHTKEITSTRDPRRFFPQNERSGRAFTGCTT
jgi:hypothetical protein